MVCQYASENRIHTSLFRTTDQAKVLSFPDFSGNRDPSLAFVMIGAIAVGLIGFYLARKQPALLLDKPIQLLTATRIDKRLVFGSILFGGRGGICSGPARTFLSAGMAPALIFVISMLFGMMRYRWTFHLKGQEKGALAWLSVA